MTIPRRAASGLVTLLLLLALTAIGLIIWVGLLFGSWGVLRLAGVSVDLWGMIEALSAAVTAAALLSGGYLAYRELDEVSNTRYIDVSNRLFEELNDLANVEARRWIYQHLPNNPSEGIASLPSEGRDAIKRTLNSLDHTAFLTQSGWIPEEMIMPWMNPMVVKIWRKLAPYVAYERQRRHEPDYYEHAEALAERCLAWRTQHIPEAEAVWLDDAL